MCSHIHPYSQTVIHYCAAQNFVEFLHDLADMGASIDLADSRGFTPLHLAAGSGRTSAVSALLGRGADANVASPNGDTPLHLACSYGHVATVSVCTCMIVNFLILVGVCMSVCVSTGRLLCTLNTHTVSLETILSIKPVTL